MEGIGKGKRGEVKRDERERKEDRRTDGGKRERKTRRGEKGWKAKEKGGEE